MGLKYTDTVLKKVMRDFITFSKDSFTYSELYGYVMDRAMRENQFKTEPYTQYTEIALTEYDEHRISAILWQMIWAKELFIEFRNTSRKQTNETVFGVVRKDKR